MSQFKKIMITLDRTAMDASLIRYAAFLNELLEPEKIYFIHVEDDLDMPASLREEYPEIKTPFDEKLKMEFQELIEKNFNNWKEIGVEIDIVEGTPLSQILHWANVKMVDLIISGRKDHSDGSGVLPQKLARKAPCSVMSVPENPPFKIDNILVPTDFSEYAAEALLAAMDIKAHVPDAKITCENSYQVPTGYYKTGKSFEEFAEIMKGHAVKAGEKMMSIGSFEGADIDMKYTLNENHKVSEDIQSAAEKLDADLVVMGSRGKTGASVILLGSVTEKFSKLNHQFPLLIVKHKNESFGVEKALEEM